jgi:hypothetical protein
VATESQLRNLSIGWAIAKANRKERITQKCVQCEKLFSKLQSEIHARLPFCSRQCYWNHKKGEKQKHLLDQDGRFRKEIAEKISKSNTGKSLTWMYNEKHHQWKGKKASYFAKHMWIQRKYGKADRCENPDCVYPRWSTDGKRYMKAPKMFNYALIHGCEHDHNRDNYWRLCVSCHRNYDIQK